MSKRPLLVAAALLAAGNAHAVSINSISVGASTNAPMGNVYQTLDRSTGIAVSLWDAGGLGENTDLRLTGTYHSFPVRNVVAGASASVITFGTFLGVETKAPGAGAWGFAPSIGLDIGTFYESLKFEGIDPTPNSSMSIAARIVPGFDVPLFSGFGLRGDLPVAFVFNKTTFIQWSGVLSLRMGL